jgi:glucose-1-phosphate adenylyltransferase
MLKDYMGILALNENDDGLKRLTKNRTIASIPFGGRYRVIDFALSNLVNAGITNVGIFAETKSRSLLDHIGSGKPWDLDRKNNGIFLFSYNGCTDDMKLLQHNMDYLYKSKENNVIISPSYMICNLDYEKASQFHEQSGKDITVIYKSINSENHLFNDCDLLNINDEGRVISVGKNIGAPSDCKISMEMFIMSKQVLIDLVLKGIKTGMYTTLKDAVYKNINNFYINGYEFNGYAACINSINSFYRANMDMLNLEINRDLFFKNGKIYTKVQDEAPTKYENTSKVSNSLIANGCVIEGTVENSIIFRRVKVEKNAIIKNSIIMQNCIIDENAKLYNTVLDKNILVERDKDLRGHESMPLVLEKKTLF